MDSCKTDTKAEQDLQIAPAVQVARPGETAYTEAEAAESLELLKPPLALLV